MEKQKLKISDIEIGALDLQQLYAAHGYHKFKMSRFEELEFYTANRSFLEDDRITAFSDPSGKLLALRPDVTLSIVKNAREKAEKVYYGEYVYRVAKNSPVIDEILQVGLEYIGPVDHYTEGEVVWLALQSLSKLSEDYLLDVSHMGLLAALLDETGVQGAARDAVLRCLGQKNMHEAKTALLSGGVTEQAADRFVSAAAESGDFYVMLSKLRSIFCSPGAQLESVFAELESLYRVIAEAGLADKIRLDLSVINDMNYYNGIVFMGYVRDVPFRVLSGGRYDHLIEKLAKQGGAIGFAVYLGELEQYVEPPHSGADVLLTYDSVTPAEEVMRRMRQLAAEGKSVLVTADTAPAGDYSEICHLNNRGKEV